MAALINTARPGTRRVIEKVHSIASCFSFLSEDEAVSALLDKAEKLNIASPRCSAQLAEPIVIGGTVHELHIIDRSLHTSSWILDSDLGTKQACLPRVRAIFQRTYARLMS
jgi:hypothetical protein